MSGLYIHSIGFKRSFLCADNDFPNTSWGRHNRKIAEKQKAKAALLKPENIFKARRILEKKQQRSLPKRKRMSYGKGKKHK